MKAACSVFASLALVALYAASVSAQGSPMIQVQTPFNSISDSFFERVGVDFGFQLAGGRGPGSAVVGYNGFGITPNIVFGQNSVGSAVPQFGGFDPNTQATFGFSVRDSSGNAMNFGILGGKGNTRTFTNQTPSVTLMNGTTASVFDGQLQPFVTGIIPVVGQAGMGPVSYPPVVIPSDTIANPLTSSGSYSPSPADLLPPQPVSFADPSSTATSADISIAEIQANQLQQVQAEELQLRQEVEQLLAKAQQAESDNNPLAARSYYRKAYRKIADRPEYSELKSQIQQRFSSTDDRR